MNDNEDNVIYMYGQVVEDIEDKSIVGSWEEVNKGGPFRLDDTVTIPRGEYDELLSDSMFLGALVISGVDNWDGYEAASDLFNAWNEEIVPAND